MRRLACFFLIQSLIIPLLAQQPSSDQTLTEGWILDIASDHVTYKHWDNGRAWQKLTPQMRIMMVSGIEQGLVLAAREAYSAGPTATNGTQLNRMLDDLLIGGFKLSDLVSQIDVFYQDSSNLRIPVADAYKFSMKKMHGAKSWELEDFTASLRQTYNK